MLADYDGPAIQLGTGGISGPTEEEEEGKGSYYVPNSYVYFGVNSGNSSTPIKWRVLDADTANEVRQSLESLQHIFDSKLQAGMLLNKRCKELGLKFNKVKKIYEAA